VLSNLIGKARNLHVTLWLRSGRKLAVKVLDYDDIFCEVIVKINEKTGEFAATREEFDLEDGVWIEDRILVNIDDISLIV